MSDRKTRNIIISGTNMWNPGDDFVRGGVIRILHELFSGYQLNFFFYNFNQDFFPQSKFSGITNMVSKGDIEQYRDFVDYVVIAGLSAGAEIKDLYQWIIDNCLEDRVFLIGAGYENTYVERYIHEEPEATIFRNAKIITGRTQKTPNFIPELSLPYHHINCPALLSVPSVKHIQPGRKITRIALSLQLPHEIGIVNHCCSQAMYELGIKILKELTKNFEVEVIAHHKSEYFHFLHVLKDFKIPVIFSSFYHDLFEIYPRFDLVVTTRLHSSLFANGFGIPGIIINDTDRHTHCLEGFPHSVLVNSHDSFKNEFSRVYAADLGAIAIEAETFKGDLIQKYVKILKKPFGITSPVSRSSSSGLSGAELMQRIGSPEVKRRVLTTLAQLTPDVFLTRNLDAFNNALQKGECWFDSPTFLNWYAVTFKPANYLEVGVRRGRSMAQVVVGSPHTRCFGFDMWIPDYSGVDNPGPEFVLSEFKKLGALQLPELIKGNSHVTLTEFWANPANPQYFDLIFIDGDHTYEGAKQDLDLAFMHLAPSGALLFDDISHPSHPELYPLWNEYKQKFPEYLFIEDPSCNGTACAFKPPFTHLKKIGTAELPVHFFTIVLNGEPFIRYHSDVFKTLPFRWHWHIIEGVADLKHDTAWSVAHGGKITDELHNAGHSNDGTTEYLDLLASNYPENITLYRKPKGFFWDGKLEMVRAPLQNITEPCLLWQVDADELWTANQICKTRNLFMAQDDATAAYFLCHYFVGEKLVTTTRNTYGNYTNFEWLRCWRYMPGDSWQSHEPPRLCRRESAGTWEDLAGLCPLRHSVTEVNGLIFQHYAYSTAAQLRFKEVYYGYEKAVLQWNALQSVTVFPVYLKNYFQWVNDDAIVNTAQSQNIQPVATKNSAGCWTFRVTTPIEQSAVKNIIFIRTDSIGDTVLASSMLQHIYKKFSPARITVLCQNHIKELYEYCPYVDAVMGFDKEACQDEQYRSQILQMLQKINADIALNTVYSREWLTDFFTTNCGARERVAFWGDLSNMSLEHHEYGNAGYSKLLESSGEFKSELNRYNDFLAGLGIEATELTPKVFLAEEDYAFADRFFEENGLTPERTIALFAGAQHDVRIYEKYGKALAGVCRENSLSVVALGSADDYGINQQNIDSVGCIALNFSGSITLRQSAAILSRCRLAVGAETGLAHIACAVGTPNVILLGGGHFGRFMPYSLLTSTVCLPLECYNCNWQCRYPISYCIKGISAEVVKCAIEATVAETSLYPRIFIQSIDRWLPPPHGPIWRQMTQYIMPLTVKSILV